MKTRHITLLELIITSVVFVILVSLATPVYFKIREQAQGFICKNNLKQLGLGFVLYTNDNSGYLPHKDNGSTEPPKGYVWYKKLEPYLGKEGIQYRQEEGFDHESRDYENLIYSYKMNSRLEDYKGKKGYKSSTFRRLENIKSTSYTVLIFDGRTDKRPYSNLPYGMHTSVMGRHDDKASFLFCDWTTKSYKRELNEDSSTWSNGGGLIWDPDYETYDEELVKK